MMLSFATEFPINAVSQQDARDCVAEWLKGSPFKRFTDDQIKEVQTREETMVENDGQTIEVLDFSEGSLESIGFRHSSLDKKIIWTTSVIFSSNDTGSWVGVRTDHVSIEPQISIKPAKKPQVVKFILNRLGGGLDGELHVQDAAHQLANNDLNMAVRLMNGDSENYLPIVYVSRNFDNSLPVNIEPLSRVLGGLAHVVVEPSRGFSIKLQSDTNSRNAYGGALGIYFPTGERFIVLPDDHTEFETRLQVVEKVRQSLLIRRPLPRCTWTHIEAMRGRQEIDRLRSEGSTDLDAYTKAFDQENNALKEKVSSAEEEIARLKAEVFSAAQKSSITKSRNSSKQEMQDYFPGESDQVLIDALNLALSSVQEGSRRHEILTKYISGFSETDEASIRKEKLKQGLKSSKNLDAALSAVFADLGFEISSKGKHHKLIYQGDDRYVFSMAKTTSDHRAAMNFFSDIAKKIY